MKTFKDYIREGYQAVSLGTDQISGLYNPQGKKIGLLVGTHEFYQGGIFTWRAVVSIDLCPRFDTYEEAYCWLASRDNT
jgi:hypothetical protein